MERPSARLCATDIPKEIMLHFWSYLDVSKLLRASTVCRAWRNNIKNSQELWTRLDLVSWEFLPRSLLPDLLVRSGNRKVSLAVCAQTLDDLNFLGRCLEDHASRIRSLHIDFESGGHFEELPFRFGMPALQSLTVRRMHCDLPEDFLAGNAPLLRSSDFDFLGFRAEIPTALEHLTSLKADDIRDLEFRSLPHLTFLEIRSNNRIRPLPHVPQGSRLRHVVFRDYRGSYAELHAAGYTRLQRLEVVLRVPDSSVIWEILESWAQVSSRPALETVANSSVMLTVAPYNNSLTFRLDEVTESELQWLYQREVLEKLVNIAFPQPGDFVVMDSYIYGTSITVQLPKRFLMLLPEPLPNLLAYTIYIIPGTAPSLLDLDVMQSCGTLHAPSLKTLIIRRSPCSALVEKAARICPSRLALFISEHLQFDAEVLHELVLDGVALKEYSYEEAAVGEYDDGEAAVEEYDDGGTSVEVLESLVRTITVRATLPRGAS